MAFSANTIAQAREMARQAQTKVEQMRKTALTIHKRVERGVEIGAQVGEIGGTAMLCGWANGRWGENGELALMGVPVDLLAGVALHGAAFLGFFGDLDGPYRRHGHNVGTGAIASAAYRTGARIGAEGALKQELRQVPPANQLPPWMQAPWQSFAPPPSSQQQPQGPQQVPQNFIPR